MNGSLPYFFSFEIASLFKQSSTRSVEENPSNYDSEAFNDVSAKYSCAEPNKNAGGSHSYVIDFDWYIKIKVVTCFSLLTSTYNSSD